LITPIDKLVKMLSEGDSVNTNRVDSEYKIDRLIDETSNMKEIISSLLEKLKNKINDKMTNQLDMLPIR